MWPPLKPYRSSRSTGERTFPGDDAVANGRRITGEGFHDPIAERVSLLVRPTPFEVVRCEAGENRDVMRSIRANLSEGEQCPSSIGRGSRFRILSVLRRDEVVVKILEHLGLLTEAQTGRPCGQPAGGATMLLPFKRFPGENQRYSGGKRYDDIECR